MTILAIVLLSLQSTATSAPLPVNDAEVFCVFNALDKETLADIGELIVDKGQDSLPEIGEYAAGAVDQCAKKWRWKAEQRAVGALTAAARAAIQTYEASLNGRFNQSQLKAIFDQLSDEEKQGLTIAGYSQLDARGRYKQTQQLEAIFKRNNVRATEYYLMTALFFAVARYQELLVAWAHPNLNR